MPQQPPRFLQRRGIETTSVPRPWAQQRPQPSGPRRASLQTERQRHEDDREGRGRDHAAYHAGADRMAAGRASACADRQRQDAQDERQRGHDDRPESKQAVPLRSRHRRRTGPRDGVGRQIPRSGSHFSRRGLSVTRPIWNIDVFFDAAQPDRGDCANKANDTAVSTASRIDQRSYCAAKMRNHQQSDRKR